MKQSIQRQLLTAVFLTATLLLPSALAIADALTPQQKIAQLETEFEGEVTKSVAGANKTVRDKAIARMKEIRAEIAVLLEQIKKQNEQHDQANKQIAGGF